MHAKFYIRLNRLKLIRSKIIMHPVWRDPEGVAKLFVSSLLKSEDLTLTPLTPSVGYVSFCYQNFNEI